MPPQQVVFSIIGIIVILIGAYYVTYYIGSKASGRTRTGGTRNSNIIVRDRFSIARDKGFYIVEIAGKIYIVGATTNAMTVLDTFDAEDFEELVKNSEAGPQMPWSDTPVGRYGNKLTQRVVAFVASRTGRKDTFADTMKQAQERNAAEATEASVAAEANENEASEEG